MSTRLARGQLAAVAAAVAAGCTATVVPPDGLSDARARAVGLERRVKELEARNAELEAQLAAAAEERATPAASGEGSVDREVAEATPRMVSLAFAGGSSEWSAGAGALRAAVVHVAVEPRDGLGRVIQVAGRCEVAVAAVDPSGRATELGQRSLSPTELRAAWRAGFMGTHYSIDVPVLVPESVAAGTPWTAAVSITDGWTHQARRAAGTVAPPRR